MKTLFADSFFYFAFLNPADLAHEQADAFIEHFDGKIVTTASLALVASSQRTTNHRLGKGSVR